MPRTERGHCGSRIATVLGMNSTFVVNHDSVGYLECSRAMLCPLLVTGYAPACAGRKKKSLQYAWRPELRYEDTTKIPILQVSFFIMACREKIPPPPLLSFFYLPKFRMSSITARSCLNFCGNGGCARLNEKSCTPSPSRSYEIGPRSPDSVIGSVPAE